MKVVQLNIIELCKQNNRKAQLQLYNQYCDGMYCIAKRFVNHTAEAEDVVQETIIKVLTHLKNFKWVVSFKAWLFKIAHNECINKIRDRRLDTFEEDENYLENAVADESPQQDLATALSALMVNLSFVDRNIMLLRYRTELEFQEIADI